MKYLELYEDATRWYRDGKLEKGEDDDFEDIETGVYPGAKEFFKKFPVGTKIRIHDWFGDVLTGKVTDHEMRKIGGTIVIDGINFHTFPTLIVRTDQKAVIPDYNGFDDRYTNTIYISKLEYDHRGERWFSII